MPSHTQTDEALVAPYTRCEAIRVTIEKANRVLEDKDSTDAQKQYAISGLKQIYLSESDTRTRYHFAIVCCLLTIHSLEDPIEDRKAYAGKCTTECKRKLKLIEADLDSMPGEHDLSKQLFTNLQKKLAGPLFKINKDIYLKRNAGKSFSPTKLGADRHVVKKKKVSWGGAVARYEDGEEDDEYLDDSDDDMEDVGGDDDDAYGEEPRADLQGITGEKELNPHLTDTPRTEPEAKVVAEAIQE